MMIKIIRIKNGYNSIKIQLLQDSNSRCNIRFKEKSTRNPRQKKQQLNSSNYATFDANNSKSMHPTDTLA